MDKNLIKTGILMAYDYNFIKHSLPVIYGDSDTIVISIDKDRLTWSGNKFDFDEHILDWIKEYDIENKISIYQDKFFIESNSSMQNDTRQRNMTAEYMGLDGWHIQIDVDEVFINFNEFVKYLKYQKKYLNNPKENPIVICAYWVVVIKSIADGFFFDKSTFHSFPVATNYPIYKIARDTLYKRKYLNYIAVHHTYNRDEEALLFKLLNWSHNAESINKGVIKNWKLLDESNFKKMKIGNFKSIEYCRFDNDNFVTNIKVPILKIFYDNSKNKIKWIFLVRIIRKIMKKFNYKQFN